MRKAVTQIIELAGLALLVWGVVGLLDVYAGAVVAGVILVAAAVLEDRAE